MVEKDVAPEPENSDGQESAAEVEAEAEVNIDEVDPTVELTAELARVKDQLLRNAADFENYRRRINRQRDEWPLRARAHVVRQLLPILDDLDRTIQAAEQSEQDQAALESLKSGVDLVHQNFHEALGNLGVETIKAIGEPFDENLHEAVMQAPATDGAAPNTVLHEVKRGYVLGDIVLRHSQVIVSIESAEEVRDDPVESAV